MRSPRSTPWRVFAAACACAAALAGCADDGCDPQSSIPCSWIEDDDKCTPTPALCNRSAPSAGYLQIDLSAPAPVRVTVYRGSSYETGTLMWSGPPVSLSWSMTVPVGNYSATALYVNGGDSVLVIDGVDVQAAAQETCDGTCYSSGTGAVDLKLR
jgi:hypothetical protein